MPYKLAKPCKANGCPELTHGRYCDKHKHLIDEGRIKHDGCSYSSKQWRKLRRNYLNKNPLCVECLKKDKIVPATVVDHVVPHRGDKALFLAESNFQSLCVKCHNSKTRNKDQYQEYKY